MSYKHLLAAVDLAEDAEFVLGKARENADAYSAQLSVITVLKPLAAVYGGLDLAPLQGPITFERDAKIAAQEKLTALAASTANIEADHVHVRFGVPAVAIRESAEELDADLIVLGTHGRHGVSLLLGSTASGVLHGIDRDVLALRVPS